VHHWRRQPRCQESINTPLLNPDPSILFLLSTNNQKPTPLGHNLDHNTCGTLASKVRILTLAFKATKVSYLLPCLCLMPSSPYLPDTNPPNEPPSERAPPDANPLNEPPPERAWVGVYDNPLHIRWPAHKDSYAMTDVIAQVHNPIPGAITSVIVWPHLCAS